MTWAAFFSLIGFHFVGMASPGPDIFLVLRLATKSRKHAFAAVLGVTTGALFWITLTVFGLAAVLNANPSLMGAIQLGGGLYLMYMAFSMIKGGLASLRAINEGAIPVIGDAALGSAWSSYRTGILTNLSNPKVVLFFTAVLSQFIPLGTPAWILWGCAVMLSVTALVFFGTIAFVVSTEAVMRRLVMAGPWIDIAAGGIFVVLSVMFIYAGAHTLL